MASCTATTGLGMCELPGRKLGTLQLERVPGSVDAAPSATRVDRTSSTRRCGLVAHCRLEPDVASVRPTAKVRRTTRSNAMEPSRTASLAMQFAGRGRLEGHPPGDVDGARF